MVDVRYHGYRRALCGRIVPPLPGPFSPRITRRRSSCGRSAVGAGRSGGVGDPQPAGRTYPWLRHRPGFSAYGRARWTLATGHSPRAWRAAGRTLRRAGLPLMGQIMPGHAYGIGQRRGPFKAVGAGRVRRLPGPPIRRNTGTPSAGAGTVAPAQRARWCRSRSPCAADGSTRPASRFSTPSSRSLRPGFKRQGLIAEAHAPREAEPSKAQPLVPGQA